MSQFPDALELLYFILGEPRGFSDHPQQRNATPAFTPENKSSVSGGGDPPKKRPSSHPTGSSPLRETASGVVRRDALY